MNRGVLRTNFWAFKKGTSRNSGVPWFMRRQTSVQLYTFSAHSSLIQTILSALEFHQILLESSRAITADWELHPTPKNCYVVLKFKNPVWYSNQAGFTFYDAQINHSETLLRTIVMHRFLLSSRLYCRLRNFTESCSKARGL